MTSVTRHPRDVLPRLFTAAIAAVAPGPAVQQAIRRLDLDSQQWIRLLALGKAAVPMATAAADAIEQRGLRVRDGLVIPPAHTTLRRRSLRVVAGDHPLPGAQSLAAADAVERFVRDGRPGDLVLVLLSGGTSSLIAAPMPGIETADFAALHRLLHGSGLPVGAINRLRRRCQRWSGGRLAVALAPARIEVLAISDVPGDILADIGSGPCAADPDTAGDLVGWLAAVGFEADLPPSVRRHLADAAAGRIPETPKAHDPRLLGVTSSIIASNRHAIEGALRQAAAVGLRALPAEEPLAGEATAMGRQIARRLCIEAAAGGPDCLIWGGETTVRLPSGSPPPGGRSQELALAAGEVLAEAEGETPALLAAGTDGRDGPTDAAGGYAEPGLWRRIRTGGRDPAADLAAHQSHVALASANALLRTGATGTNVMDLVIGLVR